MLRDEVEALLKIEGLELEVEVDNWCGRRTNWRVGRNELWTARIPLLGGAFVSEGEPTNHKAATSVYKCYLEFKDNACKCAGKFMSNIASSLLIIFSCYLRRTVTV